MVLLIIITVLFVIRRINDNSDADVKITHNTTTVTENDTINYKILTFKKIDGYNYASSTDGIMVYNDDVIMYISFIEKDFKEVKEKNHIEDLNSTGEIIASNRNIQNIGEIEIVSYECDYINNNKVLLLYTSYPSQDFSISVSIKSSDNNINYSYINDYVNVINNSNYNN